MRERVGMHPKVYEAAKSGNFHSLMTIISENGEDLSHQTTPKRNNILHIAAQYRQVNLIAELLRHPSGPSLLWQGNFKGDTALHVAAKVGSNEAVRVLADLAKSPYRPDTCKELLRRPNSHGDTALHCVVRGGHYGAVKLLIEEDPQLCDITNVTDESPLYLAVERRLSDIVVLVSNASSSSSAHKGPKGLTALHAAVFYSLPSRWKILEKRPEVIRGGDDLGWTPLHYVACIGKVEEVQLLMQHDTSVAYDIDKEGQSALHIAAFQGHASVLDELLSSCPNACDILNTKGQTALHVAVIGGRVNVVEHILQMPNLEYLINKQDIDGNTALHLATLHKQYKIIYKLARDTRVDRRATNKDHLTPFQRFLAHKEVGFRAAKVRHVLERSFGFPAYQGWVIEHVKKSLDEQHVEGQCDMPVTTKSNTALRIDEFVKYQHLLIALIATVAFASSVTMPGGYNSEGMENLAGRAAFKAFVILNSAAFGLSMLALSLLFFATSLSDRPRAGYAFTASLCTYMAEVAMILAFACCTYVVLPRSTGIGICVLVGFGGGLVVYHVGIYLDPEIGFFGLRNGLREYVQKLLFDSGLP